MPRSNARFQVASEGQTDSHAGGRKAFTCAVDNALELRICCPHRFGERKRGFLHLVTHRALRHVDLLQQRAESHGERITLLLQQVVPTDSMAGEETRAHTHTHNEQ